MTSESVPPDGDFGHVREITFETSTQRERTRKNGSSIYSENSIENESVFSDQTVITTVPNEVGTSDDKVQVCHSPEEREKTRVRRLPTVERPHALDLQRSQSENKMLYDSSGNAYTLYSVNPEPQRKTYRSVSYTPSPVLEMSNKKGDNSEQGRGLQMNQKRRHVSAVVSPQQQFTRKQRPVSSNSQYIVENPSITKMNRQLPQASTPVRNGGNMVLQLMFPPGMNNNYEMNNNYLTTTLVNDANIGQRRRQFNSVDEPTDIYVNSAYTNTAYSEDLDDIMGFKPAFSIAESVPRTFASDDDSDCVPSSPIEKTEMFKKHITIILSTIYALLIVTIGFLFYISDAVLGNDLPAEYFSLYLVVVAFIYLVYLMFDVRRYMSRRAKYKNNLANRNQVSEIECEHLPNGAMQVSVPLPEAAKLAKELPNHYCLSKGRHSGSFFLKIGAAGFCLGHLVHSGLLLGYQIVFLTSESEEFFACASAITLIVDILYPLYSFLLLFFLFKYSNVIINRHTTLARFGFMHCISSNICFWLWTILRETIDALATKEKNDDYEQSTEDPLDPDSSATASDINFFFGQGESAPVALPLTAYSRRGAEELVKFLQIPTRAIRSGCYGGDDGLSVIYKNYSPYLYPFSVEFSILVVGVLFIIWQSIGKCREQSSNHSSPDPSSGSQHSSNVNACTSKDCESNNLVEDDDKHESNLVLHADCHAANKGLFSGIVAIMISVVSIILFMIAVNNGEKGNVAVLVNSITEIILLSVMLLASVFAYKQITKLDINKHPISLLDDLLLFICLPTFFIDAVLGLLPALDDGVNALTLVEIILRIAQVLVQTPLINDGLRRCSNSKELRKQKPGRELITFLVVANVAMWFTQVFQIKAHGLKDDRYGYYGAVLWTVLGHLTIPLTMFYRFHSSVCLGDIWMHAYEKGGH